MTIRRLHRVIGVVMLLPLVGWALTGAVFFLKPGYAGAYDLIQVKTYPLEPNISIQSDSSWLEARLVKTALGEHLLARTASGWTNLNPRTLQANAQPSPDQITKLITDAISGNTRYGRVSSIEGNRIATDTGVRIELDWNRLSLTQRGNDTDRLDALYKIHYLQWTGFKNADKVLGATGILLVLGLSLLGAVLFFKG
jgi:hypothetical protein